VKTVLTCVLLCLGFAASGQQGLRSLGNHTDPHEGCARSLTQAQDSGPDIPALPSVDQSPLGNLQRATCQYTTQERFASLSKEELWDYLITLGDPRDCVNRVIYSFHSEWSPIIFSDEKVRYIAEQGKAVASAFDGQTDNGTNAVFAYLSIAALNSTFYTAQIPLSDEAWDAMGEVSHILAANPLVDGDTQTSYYAMAHMFFTASFGTIGQDPAILQLSKRMLEGLANSSFQSSTMSTLYPYYYCYYYILDLYHRYPVDDPDFVRAIADLEGTITALGLSAANTDLTVDNQQFFDEISLLTVTGLSRYAPHEVVRSEVEPSLQLVTDTYGTTDARWISAALSLVQNQMEFALSEDEIITAVRSEVLPHTYYFHDKKMIIYTQLDYQEVINLYQASTEVESQFFRMLGHRQPVDMGNDTLHAVVYGTRSDYQNYNHILYGINFPNSGGVYIESQSTMYTYDRTEQESTYSLEELFRHEYAHYLQGKYIIPGGWGQSPMYDDSRLVWFEEGMAQFLSGSTRHNGIKTLEVVRDRINADLTYNSLSDVLQSSYGDGNSGAYYIYGAMFWSKLYHDNPNRVIELIQYLRGGHVSLFDNVVSVFESSPFEQGCFESFIDTKLGEPDFWHSPVTMGPLPYTIHTVTLPELEEAINSSTNLNAEGAIITVDEQPRRFEITGVMTIGSPPMDLGSLHLAARDQVDRKILELQVLTYNNLDYTTGHFENLRIDIETDTYIADYVISGPINDTCVPIMSDEIVVNTLQDRSEITLPPAYHGIATLRYRPQGTEIWNYLDNLVTNFFLIEGLDGHEPYEFEITYSCGNGSVAPFSRRALLEFCPTNITFNETVNNNVELQAAQRANVNGIIESSGGLFVATGSGTYLQNEFTIFQGGTLEVSIDNCIN